MAASSGINRSTGKLLQDWDHVLQSMSVIFTTRFGERVMRRYFGSNIPALLGENAVPETFVRFYAALAIALYQEPRVKLLKVTPLYIERRGHAGFWLDLQYRPRGHLGDFTPEGARRVAVNTASPPILTVTNA